MKKNFLKVAALLIAAMLLVVSCSQEVAPKDENNGRVKATIGVAYGKDVTVGYNYNAAITYKYNLEPLWSDLENGAPIYGATNGEVLAYAEGTTYLLTGILPRFSANYVTPGYWKITVNGYVGDKVVLTGSTKAYFNSGSTNATVYVSPKDDVTATGNVTITLVMEDLDADDAVENNTSKIKYYLDDAESGTAVPKVKKADMTANDKYYTLVKDEAAHVYKVTLSNVTAGYHTITLKVDNYDGGVTKSFLMIPGNDVTISGSIYPSKFVTSPSDIKVVTLSPVVLTINTTPFDDATDEPVPITETTFTAAMATFDNTGLAGEFTYDWYIDGKLQDVHSNSATLTTPTVPGDYSVTCVATLTAIDEGGVTHVLYGGELFAGKIRVEADSNKKNPQQ